MPVTLNCALVLDTHRCWTCGNYWAVESRAPGSARCPVCAGEDVKTARKQRDKLELSNRALRGALTRAKR